MSEFDGPFEDESAMTDKWYYTPDGKTKCRQPGVAPMFCE
jgi:hypothetical protein